MDYYSLSSCFFPLHLYPPAHPPTHSQPQRIGMEVNVLPNESRDKEVRVIVPLLHSNGQILAFF